MLVTSSSILVSQEDRNRGELLDGWRLP